MRKELLSFYIQMKYELQNHVAYFKNNTFMIN